MQLTAPTLIYYVTSSCCYCFYFDSSPTFWLFSVFCWIFHPCAPAPIVLRLAFSLFYFISSRYTFYSSFFLFIRSAFTLESTPNRHTSRAAQAIDIVLPSSPSSHAYASVDTTPISCMRIIRSTKTAPGHHHIDQGYSFAFLAPPSSHYKFIPTLHAILFPLSTSRIAFPCTAFISTSPYDLVMLCSNSTAD